MTIHLEIDTALKNEGKKRQSPTFQRVVILQCLDSMAICEFDSAAVPNVKYFPGTSKVCDKNKNKRVKLVHDPTKVFCKKDKKA